MNPQFEESEGPLAGTPLVLLLRSPDEEGEDRYVQALAERGFRAVCRPALRFTFTGDDDFMGGDVPARLQQPERYAGVIATSPRAGRALGEALRQWPERRAAWRAKPTFAVGPKTAAVLRAEELEPKGEESGTAAVLAAVITKTMSQHKAASKRRLLFLCGNRRRDVLPARLRAAGIPFEECVAYETHLRGGPWLEEVPNWAVFFSPSGVQAVQQSRERGWEAVRKAALGPTTAGVLRDAGWPPQAVAEVPTPQALAQALRRAHDQAPSR